MLQDPDKGNMPKADKAEIAGLAQQAAGMVADKAAEEAGGKVKEVKENVQKAAQVASQVAAYAGVARQIGSAFQNHAGASGRTPGIVSEADAAPQPMSSSKVSTAAAIASSGIFGVSHLVRLTIFVEGKEISRYKHFHLSQAAAGHHNFTLVIDHDALGAQQNHEMEEARQLLGKSITVTFAYKNLSDGGPERDFIGVVTQVGFTREFGNRGNIVLSGNSPTVLLDGAPHIQSFGGTQVVSLFTIANTLLKEGLGSKYDYRVEPGFTNNVSYSCQYDETHYNYLARIAQSYGEQFFYDGQKVHFGKLPPPEEPITLTFGKDVEEIDIQMRTRHVNRSLYGYNSSSDERLSTGQTKVEHTSSLAKEAYTISEKTFITPSLRIAPMKAGSNKDVEVAQRSATGSEAVNVFVTRGKTSVPFLYPGCVVQMYMRQPDSAEADYLTKLMITDISHSVDTLGNYTGYFEAIAADTGYLPGPVYHEPIAEPQIATVKANKDSQGRVQVKFDWQVGASTSEWIRVMSPDAGSSKKVSKNRGFVAIPEIDDQVMVGFVHNHPDRPYVMGGLFHGKAGSGGGDKNNVKSLSSKSGHTVELNDGGGITIKDKTGGNHVVVDGNNKVTVTSSQTVELTNGKASITLEGDKIMIYASEIEVAKKGGPSSKIEVKGVNTSVFGKSELKLNSDAKVEVKSKVNTQIEAGAQMQIKGAITNVKADGITTVQGTVVKLN